MVSEIGELVRAGVKLPRDDDIIIGEPCNLPNRRRHAKHPHCILGAYGSREPEAAGGLRHAGSNDQILVKDAKSDQVNLCQEKGAKQHEHGGDDNSSPR